ncbi:MAG TPA: deoxyribose-phosphate aldolase [Anaerolineaceae bacterium]|nr:deoxyribose-phosphate aldolase [Anaerolineaceae bacterium]HPN51098.1 deoxyribose-phosphate aldolase [Anaerolineaceae bacterium]
MKPNIHELLTLTQAMDLKLPSVPPLAQPQGKELARWIDHTILKPEATPAQIDQLCEEALTWNFATVCINPVFIPRAAKKLAGSQVGVCTVIGFPLGATSTAVKVAETRWCIEEGAAEVDMVIPIGVLKGGDFEPVFEDVQAVVEAAHALKAGVKVILEMAYLNRTEKIMACLMCQRAGADFVKTSTGFASSGATVDDVALMRAVVGEKMGVKAAGGVRTLDDARAMISAGANRLGSSAGVKIMQQAAAGPEA